jgi:hypothetical protein
VPFRSASPLCYIHSLQWLGLHLICRSTLCPFLPLPLFGLLYGGMSIHAHSYMVGSGFVPALWCRMLGSHLPSRGSILTSCLALPCCGISHLRPVSPYDASVPKDSIPIPSCWQLLPYMPAQDRQGLLWQHNELSLALLQWCVAFMPSFTLQLHFVPLGTGPPICLCASDVQGLDISCIGILSGAVQETA